MVMFNVTKMGLPSKEEIMLKLFFNEPSKQWHFKDIVTKAKISKQQANKWLKRFEKEKLIIHKKPMEKMPYFQANFEHLNYKNKKKIYALNRMYDTGLLKRLQSLEKSKAVVIFGSFAKSDWHTGSDIDVFILGNPKDLRYGTLWQGREVQVHAFKTKKDLKKIKSGLMQNVINGYFVKGDVQDLVEVKV